MLGGNKNYQGSFKLDRSDQLMSMIGGHPASQMSMPQFSLSGDTKNALTGSPNFNEKEISSTDGKTFISNYQNCHVSKIQVFSICLLGLDMCSPFPFEIRLEDSFTVMWRIGKGIDVTADVDPGCLTVEFTFANPSPGEMRELEFPRNSRITLENFTKFSRTNLQPVVHVMEYYLPEDVIRENFTVHKTNSIFAMVFAIGRDKRIKVEMPE